MKGLGFLLVFLGIPCFLFAGDIFSVKKGGEFSSPDYWLEGRYDQKMSLKRKAENFLKSKNISKESLDYLLGVENSLEKVFKDKYWFKGEINDEVYLKSAKNEYESFQLCIIPLKDDKPIEGIQLEISDLIGEKGEISKENIKYYEVGYVKTTSSANPTSFIGFWPDPLLENKIFSVKPEEIKTIWFEIYVPSSTPSGKYKGEIKIKTENSHSFNFHFYLDVWDFTLPEKQVFRTCTWVDRRNIENKYGKENGKEMFKKYLSFLLEYKINPLNVGKEYYKKDNYEIIDENIQFCLERGMEIFEIPRLEGEELGKFCNHLKEKGWFEKAMIFGRKDEPEEEDYPAQKIDSERIRKIEPKLKIFLTEPPHPELFGAVDIWWFTMVDKNKDYVYERLKKGEEVWWYRCGIPVRLEYEGPYWEYPSDTRLDRPSIDMRIFYWMVYKYKMTPATFFWNGCSWPQGYENWPNQEWNTSAFLGINGDGYIVYPGENGPLPSIRLKCLRDGIEDYEYLSILDNLKKNKEIEEILKIKEELIVNTHYYSKEPSVLLNYREKIAKLIEKNKKQ